MSTYESVRIVRRSILAAAGATGLVALTSQPAHAAAPSLLPRRAGRRARPRLPVPGFLLDSGRYTTIEAPRAATLTFAFGVNDRGRIVADYFETPEAFEQGSKRGFSFDGRTLTRIDYPGALSTEVVGLDNFGRIVGGPTTP